MLDAQTCSYCCLWLSLLYLYFSEPKPLLSLSGNNLILQHMWWPSYATCKRTVWSTVGFEDINILCHFNLNILVIINHSRPWHISNSRNIYFFCVIPDHVKTSHQSLHWWSLADSPARLSTLWLPFHILSPVGVLDIEKTVPGSLKKKKKKQASCFVCSNPRWCH